MLPASSVQFVVSAPYTTESSRIRVPLLANAYGQRSLPQLVTMFELTEILHILHDHCLTETSRVLLFLDWAAYTASLVGHECWRGGECQECFRYSNITESGPWYLLRPPMYLRGMRHLSYGAHFPLLLSGRNEDLMHHKERRCELTPEELAVELKETAQRSTATLRTISVAIRMSSHEGDTVLDFCPRDGEVGAAALQTRRKVILLEPVIGPRLSTWISKQYAHGVRFAVYQEADLSVKPLPTFDGRSVARRFQNKGCQAKKKGHIVP